jgi:hypothetical protein
MTYQSELIDALIIRIIKRLHIILVISIIFALLGFAFAIIQQKKYEVSVQFEISKYRKSGFEITSQNDKYRNFESYIINPDEFLMDLRELISDGDICKDSQNSIAIDESYIKNRKIDIIKEWPAKFQLILSGEDVNLLKICTGIILSKFKNIDDKNVEQILNQYRSELKENEIQIEVLRKKLSNSYQDQSYLDEIKILNKNKYFIISEINWMNSNRFRTIGQIKLSKIPSQIFLKTLISFLIGFLVACLYETKAVIYQNIKYIQKKYN